MSMLDRLLANEEPKDTEPAKFFDTKWVAGSYIHRKHDRFNAIFKLLPRKYDGNFWDGQIISLVDEQSGGEIGQKFVLDETLSYNKLIPIGDTVFQPNVDEEDWLYFCLRGELYIVDYRDDVLLPSQYKTMIEAKEKWHEYKGGNIDPPIWLLKQIVEMM